MPLLVGLLGGVAGLGVLGVASAWRPPAEKAPAARRDLRPLLITATCGVVAGVLFLVVTGWVVVGAAAGVATAVAVTRGRRRAGRSRAAEQERIEAIAAWCEQLRDLLSADHGIVATIGATTATCPQPIRAEVAGLSERLGRTSPEAAIGRFADELDDPSGDLVASVLLMAMSRSSRTAELLSELAATARERASMRLRVEAERSGPRSEARFVVGFTLVVVGGVLIFGRGSEFLGAYDDASGQAMLALILGCFAYGGWWMSRLTRFERPARFVSNPGGFGNSEGPSGSDSRVGGGR